MLDLGAWASEKYVVSDPIFNEEDFQKRTGASLREGKPQTMTNTSTEALTTGTTAQNRASLMRSPRFSASAT